MPPCAGRGRWSINLIERNSNAALAPITRLGRLYRADEQGKQDANISMRVLYGL